MESLLELLERPAGAPPEPDECPSIARVARCYHARLMTERELMRAIAEVGKLKTYKEHGFTNLEDWVATFLGIGYMRACELVRVSMSLENLPLLDEAYRSSRLSYDHLRALVLIANPTNEADLLRKAERLSVGSTFRMVRRMLLSSPAETRERRSRRSLEMYWDQENGMLVLWGLLPGEDGARFERAIDQVAASLPDDPSIEGATPAEVKRADALVALAGSEMATWGPKPTLVVHVDAEALATGEGAADIEDGPAIPAEDARRMLCDSLVQKVIYSKGRPIEIDATVRTAPRWMRRTVKDRDVTCSFGHCRNRKMLEAHHIVHHSDGGPTDPDNLVMLCPVHHRLVHSNGYVVRGVPPKIWIERPGKPPIRPGPPPLRE